LQTSTKPNFLRDGKNIKAPQGAFLLAIVVVIKYSMKQLLVGFGDSWTFGSELDRPQEQCWLAQLAKQMDADYINQSVPASSIGHLTIQLFDYIQNKQRNGYKVIFLVGLSGLSRHLSYSNFDNEFVNITPEAVYHTRNISDSGRPPDVAHNLSPVAELFYRLVETKSYNEFIASQTVFTFQQYCKANDIDCVFFSYFDMPKFSSVVDNSSVYPQTITKALTGKEYVIPDVRDNTYFEGKLFHPNITGHQKIAEIIKDFYDTKYTRN